MNNAMNCFAAKAIDILNRRETFYVLAFYSGVMLYGKSYYKNPFKLMESGVLGTFVAFGIDVLCPRDFLFAPSSLMIASITNTIYRGFQN